MNAEISIREVSERKQGWLARPVLVAILLLSFASAIASMSAIACFGSVQRALGYGLRGETLFVDATEKSLGLIVPGETVTASFTLTNSDRNNIRILGCELGCLCAAPKDLPFTLRASESREFVVTIHVPTEQQIKNAKSTGLELPLTLFTSSPAQSRIPLTIKGRFQFGSGDRPSAG